MFGVITQRGPQRRIINSLAASAMQRGKDSSGVLYSVDGELIIQRGDFEISKLLRRTSFYGSPFLAGHSRLITNGNEDNQPVVRDEIVVLHNGIVTNTDEIWEKIQKEPHLKIDSEVLPALASFFLDSGVPVGEIPQKVIENCRGVVSMVMVFPRLGKLALASNNGSLYLGRSKSGLYFSSESFPLLRIGCSRVQQVFETTMFDIPIMQMPPLEKNFRVERLDLVPDVPSEKDHHELLSYTEFTFQRCSRCILPETMPFIFFDPNGVCNFCLNYTPRNAPKDPAELENILSRYRQNRGTDCILPFSGGRDSSFGLHLAVERFGLRPIAYTYDWGMVTDLGRRNISRMCAQLGVENIIVAADIERKRANIRKNLVAWLNSPHLGMISILTAGDKHFFKHVETVKKQTGIRLNLWSVNPLEVTHFKSGFLGLPPDFAEERVYSSGIHKQISYQRLRLKAMLKNPAYFNSSLFDTLSGEFFRSRSKKSDYYHLFDYWRWSETEVEEVLSRYDWERASDTATSWRIGDGTVPFYNYIYHRVAGFTEHDTFRSNQIREGDLTRDEALALVRNENQPRFQNIKWYLDSLGLDFVQTVETINAIPRMEPIGK